MPKTVNRPRDDAQEMQQGPIDLTEEQTGEQMGDSESPTDSSEPQSPA